MVIDRVGAWVRVVRGADEREWWREREGDKGGDRGDDKMNRHVGGGGQRRGEGERECKDGKC